MPNSIQIPKQRLVLGRLTIELMREAGHAFGLGEAGANCDTILVAIAIMVAQLEHKPVTVSTIARYIGMPRTTVIRKCRYLRTHGIVRMHAHGMLIAGERMHYDLGTLTRTTANLRAAQRQLLGN